MRVDIPGGIASIALPRLMFRTLYYNIHLSDLTGDPGLLAVVRAGGELLERFKLRRGSANKAEYVDELKKRRILTRYDQIDGGLAKGKMVPPVRPPQPDTKFRLLAA